MNEQQASFRQGSQEATAKTCFDQGSRSAVATRQRSVRSLRLRCNGRMLSEQQEPEGSLGGRD
jgi:hypothetical protein